MYMETYFNVDFNGLIIVMMVCENMDESYNMFLYHGGALDIVSFTPAFHKNRTLQLKKRILI